VAYYTIRVYGLNGNRRVGVAVAGLGTARLKNPTRANNKPTLNRGDCLEMKLNKVDEQVIAALKEGKELTLQELTEKTGLPSKKVFKTLRKLFENELIDTKARKYKLK
jgi:uncharacterized membrane protein